MEDKAFAQPRNLELLKVRDALVDANGVYWHPVAGWARYPKDPATGCPWHLNTIERLAWPCQRDVETVRYHASGRQTNERWVEYLDDWEVKALAAHSIAGMHDRYEHTFDNWDHIVDYRQMLPVEWVLEEVAEMLECDISTAYQMLLYRTLCTRLPAPLLEYLIRSDQQLICPPGNDNLYNRPDTAQPADYHGEFASPAEIISPFTVETDGTIHLPGELTPALSRFLTFALTYNIMPWTDLYHEATPGVLRLDMDQLPRFRKLLESEDNSGRIGTVAGGCNSEEALIYLLRGRVMNAAGPRGMWAALGLAQPVDEPWELPLHERHLPGYSLSMEEAEEAVWE
ncbi:MAG: hypothetical protein ACYDCO_12830 [Armatimonadota bacterium]